LKPLVFTLRQGHPFVR